ncbi:hypothetical protein [Lysinibacillus odysseyi]|uniref:Uncharacterized protein n=1 Tax=Lysinibacillus odysseyi 34hs-1 = NBRC 100172 TaxID=1220589 RepID=A0A0A3IRV4_9BACI|nr:hypothetical protein [Lysinibacillus odysseyi]KGR87426.1 hypothetical protein CD32_03790 [Lysinibacillus odysseyi 34hs-1 = NBRC 100172]
MVIAAWIIGIIVFILSLISFWGMFLLYVLLTIGFIILVSKTGYDPFSRFGEENAEMLMGALFGPWVLAMFLIVIGRIVEFFENVGKAVKNMADDDRRR